MGLRKGTKRRNVIRGKHMNEIKRKKRESQVVLQSSDSNSGNGNGGTLTNDKHIRTSDACTMTDGSEGNEELPEIVVELERPAPDRDPGLNLLTGHIIVDARHFLVACRTVDRHQCGVSPSGMMCLESVKYLGLITILNFSCSKCNEKLSISSEDTNKMFSRKQEKQRKDLSINERVVWGCMAIGLGQSPLDEFLSVAGLPIMSSRTFAKHENYLGAMWEEIMYEEMAAAAAEEVRLAKLDNPPRLCENGEIAWTIGILDAGWSHRSHGHRYSAKSGCAVIIGFYTKRMVFLGVRNKYCVICSRYSRLSETPKPHVCFKNWSGTSTAMEADILVEGLIFCEEQYKLRIMKFVGDGDSSVHSNIISKVPYGRQVQKIECANHIVKNLKKNLFTLSKSSAINSKVLSVPKINSISKIARKLITVNKGDELRLVQDLKNIPNHVFGNHTKCREDMCSRSGSEVSPCVLDEIPKDTLIGVKKLVERVSAKAHALTMDLTSNQAEMFMSLAAKFCGGKQVNRCQRGSYQRRVMGAGLSFQHRHAWHGKVLKCVTGRSPHLSVKKFMARREKLQSSCRKKLFMTPKNKDKYHGKAGGDKHYGDNACQPAAFGVELERLKTTYLEGLEMKNTVEERAKLEERTRGQSDNDEWRKERSERITASNFGRVCKLKDTTLCSNTVKSLVYCRIVDTCATRYGKSMECIAIAQYEEKFGIKVKRCGLFVDECYSYLAASPDGLIGENGLLEVKCPYKYRNMDITEDFQVEYGKCEKGDFIMNKNHEYYYQIQGQLHVTRRLWCDFMIWTQKGHLINRIEKDDDFWTTKMFSKLENFYMNCILPELADACHPRGLPIREPQYILDARETFKRRKDVKMVKDMVKKQTAENAASKA